MKNNSENLIYGMHAVRAAMQNSTRKIKSILITDSRNDNRLQEILAMATTQKINISTISTSEMKKRFGELVHQGVVAYVEPIQQFAEHDLPQLLSKQPKLILILDGVTDPHNLGACLRSADAVGVDAVIVPRRNACGLTPVVCRTAVGAAESVPYFEVGNLVRTLEAIKQKGIWVAGTALAENSESLFDFNNDTPLAVVMGAEGEGMRQSTREACDYLLEIPMAGEVQSLNVSVATAVTLFHLARTRRFAG